MRGSFEHTDPPKVRCQRSLDEEVETGEADINTVEIDRNLPMAADVLGGFEHQVLLAVLRLGAEAYALPIVLELEKRTGRSASPSKTWVTLRRLEDRGLLTSRFVPPGKKVGGRDRRVFTLQPAGLEALKQAKRNLVQLWQDLPVLDEP
jgi:DNA-binding PadR family transcriptional regulator